MLVGMDFHSGDIFVFLFEVHSSSWTLFRLYMRMLRLEDAMRLRIISGPRDPQELQETRSHTHIHV